MIFKITSQQIRTFMVTSVLLLATWIIIGHYVRFEVSEGASGGEVVVTASFLAPMNHKGAEDHLTLSCEDLTGRDVPFRVKWISRNTAQVIITESEFPRGLQYNLIFKKAPALIPPFTVTAHKKFRVRLEPRLVALEPKENIPTAGPLELVFNTPLDPESFREHVLSSASGTFSPRVLPPGPEGTRYDYSRWVLNPQGRLENSKGYKITISEGLLSAGGGMAPESREFSFTTAPALEITEIYPRPYDSSVWLSRHITVRANQELKEAGISVEGMAGKISVTGNTAVFHPEDLFMPSVRYRVSLSLTSVHGEKLVKEYWFGITNLGSQRWVGIKLGNPGKLQVYEGNRRLTAFDGWLTINQEKVPRVTMYELNRGSSLEFNPQDTSPVRYIRLNADIMLHHLRPGESHNHSASGLPPSYCCILLNKSDLDWIFDNVPGKCMFVVH